MQSTTHYKNKSALWITAIVLLQHINKAFAQTKADNSFPNKCSPHCMPNPGQMEMITPCSTYTRSMAAALKFVPKYLRAPETSWNFQEQNEEPIKVPTIYKKDATWWLNPQCTSDCHCAHDELNTLASFTWTGERQHQLVSTVPSIIHLKLTGTHTNTQKKKVLTLFPHIHTPHSFTTFHTFARLRSRQRSTMLHSGHQTRLYTHTGQGHPVQGHDISGER